MNKVKEDKVSALSEDVRAAITVVMYNLIFCDEIAMQSMFDMMNRIEETPYYRHGVKKWIGVVRQRMRTYNIELNKHTGGYISFLADLNDKYCDALADDLFRLRNVALMALRRHKIGNAELKAEMYVAMTFALSSVHNIEHCFDGFPHLKAYRRKFVWMHRLMNAIVGAYKQFNAELDKAVGGDDYTDLLDADRDVENGFKVIANVLHDGDGIIQCCNEHATEWEKENGGDVI
jgi:hypothetical protein